MNFDFDREAVLLLIHANAAFIKRIDDRMTSGVANRIPLLLTWAWWPRHKVLLRDPQFKSLMVKAGLVDYWRKHDWPDRCRAKGEDDFECS